MQTERLTPQRKLELVEGMMKADNIKQYAEEVGVDRSYLYDLRRELQQASLQAWAETPLGRPARPTESDQVVKLKKDLEAAKEEALGLRARAEVADIVLEALHASGALQKKTAARPIFSRL